MELNLYAPLPPHNMQRDKFSLYNHGVSNLDSMESTKRIKVREKCEKINKVTLVA
jgi:hypothetical protein